MKDLLQDKRKYKKPHIRVWCHPHYIGENGDDYYYNFRNIKEAWLFIKKHKEAEEYPLIAYDGFELTVEDFRKKYPKEAI